MPATRSRTRSVTTSGTITVTIAVLSGRTGRPVVTEGTEVAVEDKKVDDISTTKEEVTDIKETATEEKDSNESSDSTSNESNNESKAVDNSENGSNDEVKSDTNGSAGEKPENGSANGKRKSVGAEEGGDAPDSTDITPKKAKVDAPTDDTNGANNGGAGEQEDKQTSVETSA
ncbi:unnamed protein product [Oppiella nova]|uniref:Uncharacterized protein n=1 Tax=Oppiella nova TaxID=334625 RepID=A0A7R9LFJ6_9ACAR|nr:unnamed protein product [Oppiella nova]CAG2163156.1 unnamed protein product [Oppiella nova]